MTRWLDCLVLAVWIPTCASAVRSKQDARTREGNWESRGESCRRAETTCGAGELPRVTERDWSAAEVAALVERARDGTVAVDLNQGRARLLSTCRLDGAYLEIKGTGGGGRMWATNRPLFRTDELGVDCSQATHATAAFVRNGDRFEAILVPLPCPPVADGRPAPGCIGRGMTGPERIEKSNILRSAWDPALASVRTAAEVKKPSPSQRLAMWALAPDEYHTTRWLGGLSDECAFRAHGEWVSSAYYWDERDGRPRTGRARDVRPAPVFDLANSADDCLFRPVFLDCFPRLFEADHNGRSCWNLAEKGRAL